MAVRGRAQSVRVEVDGLQAGGQFAEVALGPDAAGHRGQRRLCIGDRFEQLEAARGEQHARGAAEAFAVVNDQDPAGHMTNLGRCRSRRAMGSTPQSSSLLGGPTGLRRP